MWMLAVGFIGALLTGLSAASWLQGSLRYGCSWSAGGTGDPGTAQGAWACSDGIALLSPAAATVALGALALAATLLLVRATWRDPRGGARRLSMAGALAVAPAIVLCLLLLWSASAHRAHPEPGAPTHLDLWVVHALPSLLVLLAAGIAAASGLRMRASGRASRIGAVLVVAALALLLLSAALSSLGTLSLGLVATGIIGAGWYLAAGTDPVAPESRREVSRPDVDRRDSRSTS